MSSMFHRDTSKILAVLNFWLCRWEVNDISLSDHHIKIHVDKSFEVLSFIATTLGQQRTTLEQLVIIIQNNN